MKVLVTGANGYIGRHVVEKLLSLGQEVVAADIRLGNVDSHATKFEIDLFSTTLDTIYEQTGKPDVCIHMAWRNGFVHNSPMHMQDLSSHYKFLTSMIDQGLKHLSVMGSMHEVGYWEGMITEDTPCNPISDYAIAKDALRRSIVSYCQRNKVVLQWIRGYYITGDDKNNHSIFSKILEAEENGQEWFPFTTGKTKYDFISIDEMAYQISKTAIQDDVTGIINCCSGNPVSLADKVEQFLKDNNLKIKLRYGAFPDRPYDSPCIYGDPSKINLILGK